MVEGSSGGGASGKGPKILVVDDEHASDLMRSVLRGLEREGYRPLVVNPQGPVVTGEDYELEALFAVEEERPSAVILDVRFGDYDEDRLKGISILKKITGLDPSLPVLMFTQYARGPYRDTAAAASLSLNANVDFIDKLASPEEVLLRLRRLIGTAPTRVEVGPLFEIDGDNNIVYARVDGNLKPVPEIQGMKFQILNTLATAYYRSQGELVPFARLERFSEGEDSRASLRVRIREIKDAMGSAVSRRFGPDELIINVRNKGYRLAPPTA